MRSRQWLVLSLFFFGIAAFGQSSPKSAHADIVNAKGRKIGSAEIRPADGEVRIELKVSQLPPGTHAIHIHTVGKCEGPDFKSAGALDGRIFVGELVEDPV